MIAVIQGSQKIKIEAKINELAKEFLSEVNEFTFVTFDSEKTSLTDIISDCSTLPFGYDKKTVVIKNPYYFLSQREPKLPFEQDYKLLEEFIMENNFDLQLIFVVNGDLDARKSLTKKLKEKARIFKIEDTSKEEMENIALSAFKEKKVKISLEDVKFFLERTKNDLELTLREIDKLALYSSFIKKEDIEALVARPLEENSFMMLDAIIDNDLNRLLSIYYDLKLHNEEPTAIIALIASQLRLQYQVNYLNSKRMNEYSISKELNIHPYRVKLMLKKVYKLTNKDILFLLSKLAKLDLDIKSGNIDKYLGLELFFIKIMG